MSNSTSSSSSSSSSTVTMSSTPHRHASAGGDMQDWATASLRLSSILANRRRASSSPTSPSSPSHHPTKVHCGSCFRPEEESWDEEERREGRPQQQQPVPPSPLQQRPSTSSSSSTTTKTTETSKKSLPFMRCSRCGVVRYCSQQCQRQHYKRIHKGACRTLHELRQRRRRQQHQQVEEGEHQPSSWTTTSPPSYLLLQLQRQEANAVFQIAYWSSDTVSHGAYMYEQALDAYGEAAKTMMMMMAMAMAMAMMSMTKDVTSIPTTQSSSSSPPPSSPSGSGAAGHGKSDYNNDNNHINQGDDAVSRHDDHDGSEHDIAFTMWMDHLRLLLVVLGYGHSFIETLSILPPSASSSWPPWPPSSGCDGYETDALPSARTVPLSSPQRPAIRLAKLLHGLQCIVQTEQQHRRQQPPPTGGDNSTDDDGTAGQYARNVAEQEAVARQLASSPSCLWTSFFDRGSSSFNHETLRWPQPPQRSTIGVASSSSTPSSSTLPPPPQQQEVLSPPVEFFMFVQDACFMDADLSALVDGLVEPVVDRLREVEEVEREESRFFCIPDELY